MDSFKAFVASSTIFVQRFNGAEGTTFEVIPRFFELAVAFDHELSFLFVLYVVT